MGQLDGKWALVTGSSRGVGQQVALGLAKEGCNVIVHGRNIENTQGTMDLLRGQDVQAIAVSGDVGTEAGCAQIVEGVKSGPGQVDILYNNAAVSGGSGAFFEFTDQHWLDVLGPNLLGMARLCAAFAPAMKTARWGRIVNVTSGIGDDPNMVVYGVSKAAVDKYSRCLAEELRGSGVLVSYLDPGWLRTDMGGPNATSAVESVLPGALVPVLLADDGPSGEFYRAQDYVES
jgi:NAD(P)-dependent dehydrogenase (short-subunit alcohol dehydrogenase family)